MRRIQRDFVQLLREHRARAGLSQRELASRMKQAGHTAWGQTLVAKLECADPGKPQRPLSIDEFVSLCDVLGASPTDCLAALWAGETQVGALLAAEVQRATDEHRASAARLDAAERALAEHIRGDAR